jgi:hypothetical protein
MAKVGVSIGIWMIAGKVAESKRLRRAESTDGVVCGMPEEGVVDETTAKVTQLEEQGQRLLNRIRGSERSQNRVDQEEERERERERKGPVGARQHAGGVC